MSTRPIALLAMLAAGCAPLPGGGGGAATATAPATATTATDTGAADTGGETLVDVFEQVQNPVVDILWIIDNSGSMDQEQRETAATFGDFMAYFYASALDYHIGVVTTDMDNPAESGQLLESGGLKWIDATTADPAATFAGFPLGTGGSPSEQGLLAALTALQDPTGANAGFFRAGAALHLIVLSDESDFSGTAKGDLEAHLDALPVDPNDVTFSSVVAPESDLCFSVSTSGVRYIEVTDHVGGVYADLCDEDLAPKARMNKLGLQSAGLDVAFGLSAVPAAGTAEVTVTFGLADLLFTELDPATGIGDWTWDATTNTVTFLEYVPPPGSIITVRYAPAP